MASPHCTLEGELQRNLLFCSSLATKLLIFNFFTLPFPFSLKVRESKPQRNTGRYCYHYSYNDKLYSFISWRYSCLFCRGILIVGMSENESYIVRQEVSLTTEIRGHAEICQLHLNMRRSGLQAKHKGERRNNCFAGDQNKVQHPCNYSCSSHIRLHTDC